MVFSGVLWVFRCSMVFSRGFLCLVFCSVAVHFQPSNLLREPQGGKPLTC